MGSWCAGPLVGRLIETKKNKRVTSNWLFPHRSSHGGTDGENIGPRITFYFLSRLSSRFGLDDGNLYATSVHFSVTASSGTRFTLCTFVVGILS